MGVGERWLKPAGKRYAVTGTDISTIVLRKARAGKYQTRSVSLVPGDYAKLGFRQAGAGGSFEVADTLRQRSCFTQVNILDLASCPLQSQHVIFLPERADLFPPLASPGNPERSCRAPRARRYSGNRPGGNGGKDKR